MEPNKSQRLWYLLNRFDRENESNVHDLLRDQEQFPFFYLLCWNHQQKAPLLRQTALRSPLRNQFHSLQHDAPLITINNEVHSNQNDIIDQFLENLPSITKPKKSVGQDDVKEDNDLSLASWTPPVSETFALILAKQHKFEQAIKIYEELILAKPEKRLYFATRISELQQNLKE